MGRKLILKIMIEKLLNLWRDLHIQVHEASMSTQNFNSKRSSLRHDNKTVYNSNQRENFKSSKYKNPHIQGNPISVLVDFSAETLQSRKEWDDVFKVLNEKNKKQKTILTKNTWQSFLSEIKARQIFQTKAEEVFHHPSYLTRNAEISFSS